jgi:hypothetical protein
MGIEGCRGYKGMYRGQMAVEKTEGCREDRGPWRGQKAVLGTKGC